MLPLPPTAEVTVDETTVRALLVEQHPDLAGLPLRPAAHGWDNELFRLGDDLAVRLPRREAAARLIEHEQRWLPELAPALPVRVPVPVRTGVPGQGYPWCWSVVPWFAGQTGDLVALHRSGVRDLGRLLRVLQARPVHGAPSNPARGGPIVGREMRDRARLVRLAGDPSLDVDALTEAIDRAVTAPRAPAATWLHGDLHPRNLVVDGGRLVAVVDWGDLTVGDPATDLSVRWSGVPAEQRASFVAASGHHDPATWDRARGWATAFGLLFLEAGADDRRSAALGRRTLEAVAADVRGRSR